MERDDKVYTTGQIAKMFNLSPQTIKNWCDGNKLPALSKTGGGINGQGHRRFTQAHIDAIRELMAPKPEPEQKPAPPPATSEAGYANEF